MGTADADAASLILTAAVIAAPFVAAAIVAIALAIRARLDADAERAESLRLLRLLRSVVQGGQEAPRERE